MNKQMLIKLIEQKEKEFEKNKLKRATITILCFSVAIFVFVYFNNEVEGFETLGLLFGSIFVAFFYFLINSVIFMTLFQKSYEENKMLEDLQKKLSKYE